MPSGNAIELFNCSLCSFCETSLDRLASHIRQHIKPDPSDTSSKDAIVTPREYPTGHSNARMSHEPASSNTNGTTSSMSYFNRSNSEHVIKQAENIRKPNYDFMSSKIEIVNPRSVESEKGTPKGSYIPPPPPLIEKSPQLVPYSRVYTSQINQRFSNTNVQQHSPLKNAAPVTRYIPVHPREPIYHDANRGYNNTHFVSNMNGQATYMTEFVPIAPASVKNTYDLDKIPVDGHPSSSLETFRPGIPVNNGMQKGVNVSFVSPTDPRNGNPEIRHRQHYDIMPHYTYPVRIAKQPDDGIRIHNAASQHIRPVQQQPMMNSGQRPTTTYQIQNHGPPHMQELRHSHGTSVQAQLASIQYSDLKQQKTTNTFGVPNKGTVILNPDQLLSATGNVSLDQLAGLLIVPLKKTAEISTQTDPVDIMSKNLTNRNINSTSVQTDLKMGQINEDISTRASTPLFGNYRSTDALFECLVCGEELASDHHLQEHISENHTHVCEKCYHSSTSLTEHNTHVLNCGNLNAEMLCLECNSSFTSLKKFNQHRSKVHNVRMPFRCGICNVPFETHDAVMKHMATHDTDQPEFKCRHCIKVFQSPDALSRHFARHKMVDVVHECRFCKKSFNKDSLLQDHIAYVHVISEPKNSVHSEIQFAQTNASRSVEARNDENTNIVKNHPLCRHCDLAFKNKDLLSRHIEVCSKNKDAKISAFICDVCKEYFASDILRRQHLKQDHRRTNGYRCPKCSKIYRTWSRLKFHTKQQHLKKSCPDCDMVFTKEHVLRKHQEDVHGKPQGQPGERVYTCSLCNTMLNTLTELMNHRRDVHPELSQLKTADQLSSATMLSVINNNDNDSVDDTELSVSKCPDCSEIFTSNKLLSDHIKEKHANSNKSKFVCSTCELSFDDEKRLKNHRGLIHGEKPFDCSFCDKKFQYSSQVIWHMRCHQKDGNARVKTSSSVWKIKNSKYSAPGKPKSYICQFCGAKFKQEKLLKNHKGAVHKIKLFSCDICKTKFGHSTELIWHVRTCRAKFRRLNPGVDLPLSRKTEDDVASEQNRVDSAMEDVSSNDDETVLDPKSNLLHDRVSMTRLKSPDSSRFQLSNHEALELLKNEPEFEPNIGEYSCPICQKSTKSITGMKTHYGRCHGVWGKESSHKNDESNEVAIFPCKYCDQEYQNFDELCSHTAVAHGINITIDDVDVETRQEFFKNDVEITVYVYTCPHCDVSFDNTKAIRVHAFKKHGILLNDKELQEWKSSPGNQGTGAPGSRQGDELRYKCQRCKAKFRTTKAIRIHTFKRHGFILSKKELSRSKSWVSSLNSPVNRNKGKDLIEEPNPCDKCGRVFGNYRALFTHYRQAHRITNETFVPRKPSRTELTANFSSVEKNEEIKNDHTPAVNSPTGATADSIDCPKCDRSFTQHKSLVAHLYSAHKISKDQYSDFWPNGVPILPRVSSTCPTCSKECVDGRAMRIHMFKAHGMHYRDLEKSLTEVSEPYDANGNGGADPVDENELSVVDDVKGPPVCFICDKHFKGRRALMTHEFKFHGIRWVGRKRIFPQLVRNLPVVNKRHSSTKRIFAESSTIVKEENVPDDSTPKPSNGFVCPECDARYHNRRAMTTHLCRIHRYKKEGIHEYFRIKPADDDSDATNTADLPPDDMSDNLVIVEASDNEEAPQISDTPSIPEQTSTENVPTPKDVSDKLDEIKSDLTVAIL